MPGPNDTEFGGAERTVAGVQPPPHIPTASERLSLTYRTGDPSGQTPPDNGEIFGGLRKEAVQRAARGAEGALVKGEVAEELATQAQAEIAALQAEAVPE